MASPRVETALNDLLNLTGEKSRIRHFGRFFWDILQNASIIHELDTAPPDTEPQMRILRALPLAKTNNGFIGISDTVRRKGSELEASGHGIIFLDSKPMKPADIFLSSTQIMGQLVNQTLWTPHGEVEDQKTLTGIIVLTNHVLTSCGLAPYQYPDSENS